MVYYRSGDYACSGIGIVREIERPEKIKSRLIAE